MRARETIETLNALIEACRGVEKLCRACAESGASRALQNLLRFRTDHWGRLGDEMQALVLLLNGAPARTSAPGSQWLCAWVAVKAAVLGVSDARALDTCQHAQLRALYRYDHALSGYLPERIRRPLTLQADRIAERIDAMDVLLGQASVHSQGA
jgi:uncharacterized protein (TIGR02284 family)